MRPNEFELLIDGLRSLPGVGKKQAERIAYFLIDQDDIYLKDLINRISQIKNKIHFCKQCNNFAKDELCDICANESRDQTKLCIVSKIEDLYKIEETNSFDGLYFVLNSEIDVKKNQKIDSSIIRHLMNFLKDKNFKEVILATN